MSPRWSSGERARRATDRGFRPPDAGTPPRNKASSARVDLAGRREHAYALPPRMPHKIEPAPSGRASCRGCKAPIAKGDLRFAEELANPYSDEGGTSFRYWHLACAA